MANIIRRFLYGLFICYAFIIITKTAILAPYELWDNPELTVLFIIGVDACFQWYRSDSRSSSSLDIVQRDDSSPDTGGS